jgi:Ion transport protein
LLYAAVGYFFLREFIQVVASLTLGVFTSWLYDVSNWLDMLVISLVTSYSVIMALDTPVFTDVENWDGDDYQVFRTGTALTKGVLWTAVIFFLKSTRVDFAVFLNGVFYVVQRLVAFLLAVLVILLAFAQMFWIVYMQRPVCTYQCPKGNETCPEDFDTCIYPHCDFGDSFLKVRLFQLCLGCRHDCCCRVCRKSSHRLSLSTSQVYTMMMGEIGTETRYDQVLVAQIFYVLYCLLVVILLSNVLIAIVTDSYEIVQNDRAAIVFWSNRLDFVAEMDGIASVVRRRILCMGGDESKGAPGAPSNVQEQPNGTVSIDGDGNTLGSKEWFRDAWKSIMSLFEDNVYDDVDLRPAKIEFWVYMFYKALAVIVIPLWAILGLFSVGILWPPQVRVWLLVQQETAASRAEIERRKLEQLRAIENDMKSLKNEIRKEMANDREEMSRLKAEVEAIQGEVLSDLQQVKELMTTLLDLGGISAMDR